MSDLRSSVLSAFGDQLAAERAWSEERLERAAVDGVDRAAYAREQRIVQASSALEAVSAERWQELADWLARFAGGPDAPPVRLRPRDRKGTLGKVLGQHRGLVGLGIVVRVGVALERAHPSVIGRQPTGISVFVGGADAIALNGVHIPRQT